MYVHTLSMGPADDIMRMRRHTYTVRRGVVHGTERVKKKLSKKNYASGGVSDIKFCVGNLSQYREGCKRLKQ